MQVDKQDKQGKDSDHWGVEVLPRDNLATTGSTLRERVIVQPFPESKVMEFGLTLEEEEWDSLEESMTTTEMVDSFQSR